MIIFDSLTHPTLNGHWLDKKNIASFNILNTCMKNINTDYYACAVGMDSIGNYTHDSFLNECKKYPNLIPIAGLKLDKMNCYDEKLSHLQLLGYKAIKIHPRLSGITLNSDIIYNIFESASKINIPIFLCTYYYSNSLDMIENSYDNLIKLLHSNQNTKVVLIHGGAVEIKKYMELVRFYPNLLLDLSFTILKYSGSSIDLDIKFLFKNFDRRICIGSDFPDFSPKDLVERMEYFIKDIENDKIENITYKNLAKFLGVSFDIFGK